MITQKIPFSMTLELERNEMAKLIIKLGKEEKQKTLF